MSKKRLSQFCMSARDPICLIKNKKPFYWGKIPPHDILYSYDTLYIYA